MKGFKKDGKFRPTENRKKSSLSKSDISKKKFPHKYTKGYCSECGHDADFRDGKCISCTIKRDKKTLEGSKISTNEDAERNKIRDWDALGVTVWDAGDKVNDRYTVVHKSKWNDYRNNDKETNTKYFFAMNDDPFSPNMGFSQFVGQTEDGYEEGKHLGKKIDPQTLNVDVRLAILDRITDEEGIVI